MLHVLRKKDTKEMVACWRPELEGESVIDPVVPDDEEYVLLHNMNYDTALALAEIKAKEKNPQADRPGKIWIHNDRVECDPPAPPPSVTEKIRARRVERGQNLNTPVTLEELDMLEIDTRGRLK